jgi:hypothetical protein
MVTPSLYRQAAQSANENRRCGKLPESPTRFVPLLLVSLLAPMSRNFRIDFFHRQFVETGTVGVVTDGRECLIFGSDGLVVISDTHDDAKDIAIQ